ncbi:hypothetical protein [Amycolatopsis sacchari]|uniref:hypothetical protein n=1 Tax=Amycolatopsis sacchari TaxID=115433 RepID=UPI003EB96F3A
MNRRIALAVAAVLSVPLALAAPAQAVPGGVSWQADLSTVDDDDAGVAYMGGALRATGTESGYLVLPARKLDRRVNRVVAEARGSGGFEVDVRGRLDGHDWTEWIPASGGAAVLPAEVTTVQVRVEVADQRSAVTGVRLTADEVARILVTAAATPLTYRVFATREGLTGNQTANGHVITGRDHFVALPSGRSMSPKGTGDYTVRVCKTDNSRCEYAPVWDKGPWNTQDDYWNADRQMWTDLPQGEPEAQAAYQDGYKQRGQGPVRTQGGQPGRDRPRGRHFLGRAADAGQRLGRRDVPVDRHRPDRQGEDRGWPDERPFRPEHDGERQGPGRELRQGDHRMLRRRRFGDGNPRNERDLGSCWAGSVRFGRLSVHRLGQACGAALLSGFPHPTRPPTLHRRWRAC